MTPTDRATAVRGALVDAGLHAVVWLFWLAGMVAAKSYLMRTFQGFNMKLPAATEMLLAASRWLEVGWYVPLALLAAGLAVDGMVGYLLRRSASMNQFRWVWSAAMLAVPVLLILFSFLSLWLPLIKLQQGLAR
jgi:type II secretory pathway component PulF